MLKYKDIKIADAGFVINLPERTDRKDNVTKLLNDLEISGWTFENGVSLTNEWRKHGCTKTFLNIFEKAIENKYDSIIILEDDIKVTTHTTIEQIEKIFTDLTLYEDNYDLIAFGTRPLWESHIIEDSESFGRICGDTLCAHAFLYKKSFIEYAYNLLKDFQNPESKYYKTIIDEFICYCTSNRIPNKTFKVGITIPMIFTQGPSHSDNEGEFVNYQGYIEDCYWNAINNGKNK